MPTRVNYLNLSVQQASIADFAPQGNVTLSTGKLLSAPNVTVSNEFRNCAGVVRADTTSAFSVGGYTPVAKKTYFNFHGEDSATDWARLINESTTNQLNLILELGDDGTECFMVRNMAMSANGTVATQYNTLTCTQGMVGVNKIAPASAVDVVGSINATGDITAFYNTSDQKFKSDISDMPSALDTVLSLRPVQFTWNSDCPDPSKINLRDYGLVAQEVQQVLPAIVEDSINGHKLVRYEKLTTYLLKAVQELHREIQQLKVQQC